MSVLNQAVVQLTQQLPGPHSQPYNWHPAQDLFLEESV